MAASDTPANAQAAVEALKAVGFRAEDISSFDKSLVSLRQPELWERVFGAGLAQHEAVDPSVLVAKGYGAPVRLPAMTRWKAASAIVGSSTGS